MPLDSTRLLAGRRILITRTRQQASTLEARFRELGAETTTIPTIEIAPPESWCALDAALSCLRSFDWVLFTSANAVASFTRRAAQIGVPAQPRRIAAVGPATARELQAHSLTVDLVPPKYVAEALAEAMVQYAPGASMLLVRAEEAPNLLPEVLAKAGATMTIAAAYRNVMPAASADALRAELRDPAKRPHAITFTSASTATNFFALLDASGISLDPGILLASIGPVTSSAMRDLGYPPQIEAREATIDALAEAVGAAFKR